MAGVAPSEAVRPVVRIGLSTAARTVDPRVSSFDVATSFVVSQVFETPFATFLDSPAPRPLLFQGPLIREGELRYSAALRSDVRFSDGTPLTAEHARGVLAAALGEQVTVGRDGQRLVFELRTPNRQFHSTLTLLPYAIYRQDGERLLGTGPFMLDGEPTSAGLRLIRNPYYRERSAFAALEFVVYPADEDGSCTALLEALERKEIDLTTSLAREEAGRLTGYRMHFGLGTSTALLFFNTLHPTLAERSVRRAIASAIDSFELARASYSNPLAYRATGLLPPVFGDYLGEFEMTAGDPGLGLEILRKAHLDLSGVRLRVTPIWPPRPYLPHPHRTADLIAGQIRRLGIAAEAERTTDAADYHDRIRRADYDLTVCGWIADTPDPLDFLEAILAADSDRPVKGPAHFLSRFPECGFDRLLKSLRCGPSGPERTELLRLVRDEVPVVPILYGRPTMAVSWDLAPPAMSFAGLPYLHTLKPAA